MENVVYVLVVIAIFAVQLLISLKVKFRIIRLLPTLILCILGGIFLLLALNTQDWDAIGYILLMAFTWIGAATALIALILGAVIRYVIEKNRTSNSIET